MDFEEVLQNIFNITKYNGEWLYKKIEIFIWSTLNLCGKVDYTALKADYIHPSKQKQANCILGTAFTCTEIEIMKIPRKFNRIRVEYLWKNKWTDSKIFY